MHRPLVPGVPEALERGRPDTIPPGLKTPKHLRPSLIRSDSMGDSTSTKVSGPSILLLSDGDFVRAEGRIAPSADRLHEFLFGLEQRDFNVTLASRCRDASTAEGLLAPLQTHQADSFVPLPGYRSLLGSLPRSLNPMGETHRILNGLISRHDAVIYRSNHAFARTVGRLADRHGVPAFPWWAAHPWNAIGGMGPIRSAKILAAKTQLRRMQRYFRSAHVNVILDPDGVRFLREPSRHLFLTPSLTRDCEIAKTPPRRRKDEPLRAIYAGRLFEAKGVNVLLDLVDQEDLSDIELTIAGHGALANEVKRCAKISRGRLSFAGNLPARELQEKLQRSHVCLLPSYSEGMPKILWEAFSCGLPMIATSVGGIAHHVTTDVNGFLVPTDSPTAIAAALRTLERDDDLRQRLGHNALLKAKGHTQESQLDLLEPELREAIDKRR